MAKFTVGVRLHDYGQGTPDELFSKAASDGFESVQLAYRRCIPDINDYSDVSEQLIFDTVAAGKAHNIQIAVLGTYVELAMNDESRLKNMADFKSQLAVAKALNAGCIGTETTGMASQPAGTTREQAQYCLCKSLSEILPEAERLGVTVGIEPVFWHCMNTPAATKHVLDSMSSPNLKVIFDMCNIVSSENRDRQAALWDDVGNLLGDRIVAVHFKGQAFKPDGNPYACALEESQVDAGGAFAMLRSLPQALPVLREEAVPARAVQDIAYMKSFFTA